MYQQKTSSGSRSDASSVYPQNSISIPIFVRSMTNGHDSKCDKKSEMHVTNQLGSKCDQKVKQYFPDAS